MSGAPIRATLVMEQHLGHLSYYRNLRSRIDIDGRLEPTWVEVDYEENASMVSRLPKFPSRFRGILGGRAQVVAGLRNSTPDIALFNTQVPAVLGFTQLYRQPYLLSTDITPRQYDRMAEHYGHRPDSGGSVAAAKHAINVRVFKQARKVICWSRWCGDSLVQEYGLNEDHVEVIAPGVDLRVWQPPAEKNIGSRPKLLFVGGDLERKGGRLLIEAFRRLPSGSAELNLVTRSDYLAESNDIVVHKDLSPNSPKLVSLYQSCDVFVLPSSAEAFGIAAVEACASGLPVVATRSGGLTDIVVEGETGYTVEPGDVEALADRLRLLAEDHDLRTNMGAAGRTRAELLFNADSNGRRIAELLIEHSARQPLR